MFVPAGIIAIEFILPAGENDTRYFYAVEIGKVMGLDEEALVALHAAALLHDIGKLAVPENIISKPGKLRPEEFEKMKIHPIIGAEILDRVQFPYPVVPIVRAHHEKWDGTGYPEGLKGEQIPLGARILSAVDCLDALASDRQYRRALPLHEAMAKVLSESGKSFDPSIVNVLHSRYIALERMAKDRFGHLEGNKLLSAIARGLRDCCRREDYVARLGGGEFVIVMPETKPEDMQAKLRQFTQVAIYAGRRISGEDLLSMSVGQAFYPSCGTTPDQLLSEADRQMFQAKRRYKKMLQKTLELPVLAPHLMAASTSQSTMTIEFYRKLNLGLLPWAYAPIYLLESTGGICIPVRQFAPEVFACAQRVSLFFLVSWRSRRFAPGRLPRP